VSVCSSRNAIGFKRFSIAKKGKKNIIDFLLCLSLQENDELSEQEEEEEHNNGKVRTHENL